MKSREKVANLICISICVLIFIIGFWLQIADENNKIMIWATNQFGHPKIMGAAYMAMAATFTGSFIFMIVEIKSRKWYWVLTMALILVALCGYIFAEIISDENTLNNVMTIMSAVIGVLATGVIEVNSKLKRKSYIVKFNDSEYEVIMQKRK